MTTIIAFISQKGGVGKSTLSRALAREAAQNGLTIKIADLDTQQGTCVDWGRVRLNGSVEPVIAIEAFNTAAAALRVAAHYDLLIIDAPARTSAGTLEIAKVANLIIQPSGTSNDDLKPAVREFHALTKAGIAKTKLFFALNHVGTETEEAAARTYIEEAGYSALEGSLLERAAYRQAQNMGYAVTETNYRNLNAKADALIQALINKIGDTDNG